MQHNWLSVRFYRSPDSSGSGVVDLMDDDGGNDAGGAQGQGGTSTVDDDDEEEEEEEEDGGGSERSPRPGPALGDAAYQTGTKPEEQQGEEEGDGNELTDFATKFLNLEKGMVLFDGEEEPVAFASLDPIDQMAVVQTRMEEMRAALPTQHEAQVLQSIRQAGGVDQYLRQQAASVTARPAETLSADEVNLRDIKAQFPSWTEAEQKEELEHRKTHARYDDKTQVLRERQVQQENQEALAAEKAQDAQIARNIATTAAKLTHIDDFKLDDDVRNELLGDLLEADETEPEVSRFIKSLDDPQELLRTQFWRKYGKALYEQALAAGKPGKQGRGTRQGGGSVEPVQHVEGTGRKGRRSDIVDML